MPFLSPDGVCDTIRRINYFPAAICEWNIATFSKPRTARWCKMWMGTASKITAGNGINYLFAGIAFCLSFLIRWQLCSCGINQRAFLSVQTNQKKMWKRIKSFPCFCLECIRGSYDGNFVEFTKKFVSDVFMIDDFWNSRFLLKRRLIHWKSHFTGRTKFICDYLQLLQ